MPFLQMGVANPLGLYMYVLQKGFGVKDVGPLVMRPEQAPPARVTRTRRRCSRRRARSRADRR
jgi:hypothetical protein